MIDLTQIHHVVVLSMENRSFDHMLGALALDESYPSAARVDGVQNALINQSAGTSYSPRHLDGDLAPLAQVFDPDPPHERESVRRQIHPKKPRRPDMTGFVERFIKQQRPSEPGSVLGWLDRSDVPMTYFLADNFAVCQSWFACVPSQTIPNRLYMVAGQSDGIEDNPFPPRYLTGVDLKTIFSLIAPDDWLIFSDALPLAAIVRDLRDDLFQKKKLRHLDDFVSRAKSDPPALPRLSWIEPTYSWADERILDPFFPKANDDHPPTAIAEGQALIKRVYDALRTHPVWDHCLLIVTYDEHGGFSDHVLPPDLAEEERIDDFERRGIRVPALVVSPFVKPGSLHGDPRDPSAMIWDHCSILKFLCKWFEKDPRALGARVTSGHIGSVADILTDTAQVPEAPEPPTLAGSELLLTSNSFAIAAHRHRVRAASADLSVGAIPRTDHPVVRREAHSLANTVEALRQGVLETHRAEFEEVRPLMARATVIDPPTRTLKKIEP